MKKALVLGVWLLVGGCSRAVMTETQVMDQCDACKKRGYRCEIVRWEMDNSPFRVICQEKTK